MRLSAAVLFNEGEHHFFGYDAKTAQLRFGFQFLIEADNVEKAGDLIFLLTNVDDANDLRLNHPTLSQYAKQVAAYREARCRSLSVGDVIEFLEGDRLAGVLAVESLGFKKLNKRPNRKVGAS